MNLIQNLIGLQQIDTNLEEIEELLGDLPLKVSDLKRKEEILTSDFSQGQKRLKEIKVELHKIELNVAEFKEKIEKLKDQLSLVTNNKQYDALMYEIDRLKENLDKDETNELELLEENDQLLKQVQEQETNLKSLSEDLVLQRVNLEKAIAESSLEKNDLVNQRKEKTQSINTEMLARYEKIFLARDSLAVVSLVGNSCGGCGASLPPQLATEIKALNVIKNCSICGRYLFWEKSE